MSWFFSPLGGIEKKICRYLLQRYLGNFFEEKLNLEQLNVDLRNGKGTIQNIALNCESLNELCESQGWGVEVTGGHVGSVTIQIPWNAPMSEDSSVEISELSMTLRPLPRQTDGASMLESMWSSMSSSMQLAQDCLEKSYEDDINLNTQNAPIEGLEKFAQTIDSLLNRIRAKLYKSTIRIEYVLPNSDHGIAVIIKIDELEYQNEARNNPPKKESTSQEDLRDDETDEKTHLISTYATHYLKINGISFYTEEFRIFTDSNDKNQNIDLNSSSLISNPQFYSVLSHLPDSESFVNNTSVDKQSNNETNFITSTENENKSENENESDDECEATLSSECIQIAKFSGTQEIRINMKQSETYIGPKVSLDIQLGSLNVFITPRQLHLMWKFIDIFFNDSLEYYGTKLNNAELNDDKNLDNQLNQQQKNFSSNMSGGIGNLGGWSFDPILTDDASVANLRQFSLKDNNSSCEASSFSRKKSSFEYCESVTSSMSNSSSSATTCSSKFQQRKTASNSNDLNGDISHFSVRIASSQAILLHEDILLENTWSSGPPISDESSAILMELSNKYFDCLVTANENNYVCNKNNIKFNFQPIIIEGEQQRNSNCILLKLTLSIPRFDFFEVLENTPTLLIDFNRKDICNNGFHKRPELTMTLKSTSCSNSRNKQKKKLIPRTDIHFNIENCTVEFDITLYDRINAVFSKSPFSVELNDIDKKSTKTSSSYRSIDTIVDLKIDSPNLNLRLRFPIIDSRPLHDPERVPWWKQNIRSDFLLFCFSQFRLSNLRNLIEISANEINIYFCENVNTSKIHLAKSTLIDNTGISSRESYIEYPRISIEFPSDKCLRTVLKCCMGDSDSGETSGESCSMYVKRNREPVPFSSKRVCRQSDTPHAKDDSDESETILLPGEPAEMKRFCERAMKTSKLQIKVFLPIASVQIKSKMLYEIIYNRLNSDLLMWEPISQNNTTSQRKAKFNPKRSTPKSREDNFWNSGMMDSVYIPTINEKNEAGGSGGAGSSSDDIETDVDSDSVYYTAYDKKRSAKRNSQSTVPTLSLSDCSFELDVSKAILTLFTPVRDNENRVLPEQFGEFVFDVQGFTLFTVNGFNGDSNLAYLCIQSKMASLYHAGLVTNLDSETMLRLINSTLPNYLLPTLYPTPDNLTINPSKNIENGELLSFAIEIKKVPETRVKRLRLTALIQSTTLNHNPALSQHTWINQLIDFFDVTDYPIEGGYVPYMPVTEMQLHLWNCVIDYRPKNLQFRAVAEVGNFMLSTNLISSVSGCTLRFIAEECILSLAPQEINSSKSNSSNNNLNRGSSKQLVPVLDVGLVDISLRLNNKDSEFYPKLDLRTSIQDMHIRTCSDSGNALATIIAYFASDGDLISTEDEAVASISSFSTDDNSIDLLSVGQQKSSISEVTEEQQERVNLMMAEALRETVSVKQNPTHESEDFEKFDKGVELFFFPDENQTKTLLEQNSKKSCTPSENAISEEGKTFSRSSSEEWRFTKTRRESESSNELRDILNFETSIMNLSCNADAESIAVEALPQIREELGEIPNHLKDDKNNSRKSSLSIDDDFCVIGEEEKASTIGIRDVKVSQDPLRIVDNHFTVIDGKADLLKAPEGFPTAVTRYTLCEMTVTWHLYGGSDFPLKDEKQKSEKDKENQFPSYKGKMSDAYKMGVSFSKSRQTVQFGKKPVTKLSWKTRGGAARNHDIAVDIQLTKVRFSHEIYPINTTQASRQVIIVSELEIRDRLQSSEINKFLYHPSAKHLPNKSSKHMIVIKALHIRPNLNLPTQECSLRISLLPLRLNIDQDTLLFMVKFFNEIANSDSEADSSNKKLQLQEPVMMVDDLPEAIHDLEARKMVSTNLELLMEDDVQFKEKQNKNSPSVAIDAAQDIDRSPIYFKEVIFSPDILIRLDYHGRRIELSHGPVAGLLMGLGQLQCSEIRLKKIIYKRGVLGFDKLLNFLFKEWLQDIKKNQLPAILSGVGPMYTFVQLFQGIRDLIWLPIEQYQKDGRIVRGLQLGAQSFTARTALAALEITSRIIQLLQITAETAFDMVSPGPSPFRRGRHNRKGKRKRSHHPQDIREGVATAYQIVRDGLNETANALIENTVAEHDQKGYTGAVGAVFRQVPPIVVCPVVLATQATTNVLSGVKNQLVPDARFENQMKWKDDTD